MSKKIKLTDKDLEIRINNNKSHYNQTCVFENESPHDDPTSKIACPAKTLELGCDTATFHSVCIICETDTCPYPPPQTADCNYTDNCAEPLTHATQCGGCQTGDCNQTNTCTCNESRYCDTTNCLDTGNNCESRYQVCETEGINCYDTGADCLAPESDNCGIISTECEETEVCAESYNCLYTEICVGSDNVSCETKCMNC